MFTENVIKKIPGKTVQNMRESQGYIDSLGNKSKFELEDLLRRQNKLLANKRFSAQLPDNGEKIRKFKEKILAELEHRNHADQAAKLLSRLNVATEGIAAMNTLEWTGNYEEKPTNTEVIELSSDHEEDPLRILAQHNGTTINKQKIIIAQPEETLINPDDLKEIESSRDKELLETDHIKYIVNIVEKPDKDDQQQLFLPHKTTLSSVHDPSKEKLRKKGKLWEVTAATPPLIVHGAAKTLCLHESLKLQKEQADKMQELQAKHAIERLTQQIGRCNVGDVPHIPGNCGSLDQESDSATSDDEELQEAHEEDTDKAGTVVFTVDSIEM